VGGFHLKKGHTYSQEIWDFSFPTTPKSLLNFWCINFDSLMCWETFLPLLRVIIRREWSENQGEHSQLPYKRLRRCLWAVLGEYRWRRSRLVSRYRTCLPIIFCLSGDSSTHQRYINLVYNLYLVQSKSHTRSFWCFRWKFLNLYTSYTDNIPTV
jgi:hypothetical protein